MELAKLDFTDVDSKIESLVEERRIQGQTVKLLSGQREVINPEMVPKELVNTSELNEELEKALYENQQLERNHEEREETIQQLHEYESEIKRFKLLIEARNKYIKGHTRINVDAIKVKIEGAEEANEIFRANERNKDAEKKCNQEIAIYENQTAKITKLRESKDSALREAKFPLTELKVTTAGTFFNDIPIKQLSSSENMKVAMSIAMALNEKFKVILVKDASLLDEDNLKVIREMARDNGYQVWLEKVSDSGDMGFYFIDGEIASINGEKIKEQK
ncbi:hypothetical protein ES705_47144 [subsurface metagenome]